MTIKLAAYGSYWEPQRNEHLPARVFFEMEDVAFLAWAPAVTYPLTDELIRALPVSENILQWHFYAWETHPEEKWPSDWFGRVSRLINEEDQFFGYSAEQAMQSFCDCPIVGRTAITKVASAYTSAQCWYESATRDDEGKALGNEAMEAARAISRGAGGNVNK